MTIQTTARRMAPEARKAQILLAARRVLAREGIDRFSLEEVAREASVAATLPRHYFQSRDGLLVAAMIDLLHEITDPLITPGSTPLPERLRAYLSSLAENAWIHEVWLRAGYVHPEVEAVASNIRQRMIEGSFAARWTDMTPDEQITASGWIGYVENAVAEWIRQGANDNERVVAALLDGARRLGVHIA